MTEARLHSRRLTAILALIFLPFLWAPGLSGERAGEQSKLPPAAGTKVDFKRHIEPIFQSRCVLCHNQQQQLGGLRLDDQASAMAGGYSGPVILPGKSAESRLIHLVAGLDEKIVMPMTGERLTPEEVGLLRAWIDQGAPWREPDSTALAKSSDSLDQATVAAGAKAWQPKSTHWAFIPPRRPQLPAIRNERWVRNPIDAFVLARLEEEGLQPSPEADRYTLIRRASLDLIGLPPTLDQVEAFAMDNRPDAYERLIDRLLASPHYGERWALLWMDLARYADSDGYEKDIVRPHAWRYRDWVIEALNDNMPFDQFTTEQIAGDLLPNASLEQRIATGFHRNTLTNREGGVDLEEFRIEQVLDRTSTVGTVWLGLTLGCARCHDHKYDPITQKEFYELVAFFNSTEEVNTEAPLPGEIGPHLAKRPEYERKRAELLKEHNIQSMQEEWESNVLRAAENPGERVDWDVAWDTVGKMLDDGYRIIRKHPSDRTSQEREALTDHFVKWSWIVYGRERWEKELGFKELSEKMERLHEEYPGLSGAQIIVERSEPRKTHILLRGDYRQPGIEVRPDTPAVLPPLPSHDGRATRLMLARWLVSKENPLTVRVTVNRFWQEIFGRGLVETSGDFGTRGEAPSHPGLLDWVATEFMKDWDVKGLLKLIVTSATYRQSSDVPDELKQRDPDNRLLARGPRFRLPAELIRDSALAVSGLLYPEVGGKSIRPHQPEGVTELSFGSDIKWEMTEGPERYKRGLYIFFRRSVPYPMLVTFDAPGRLDACTRRERSTTPLQSLSLLNDPVFFEAAQALAVRVLREEDGDLEDRLRHAFRLCLARDPEPGELARLLDYYKEQKQILAEEGESAKQLFPAQAVGVEPFEAAVWVGVSRVLLNLDEFVTKE